MKVKAVSEFFPARGKVRSLHDAEEQTLLEDTLVDGIPFRAGSTFKVFETENFGWVFFSSDAMTPEGMVPGRRIFRF